LGSGAPAFCGRLLLAPASPLWFPSFAPTGTEEEEDWGDDDETSGCGAADACCGVGEVASAAAIAAPPSVVVQSFRAAGFPFRAPE